jgi:TnpA family transposase
VTAIERTAYPRLTPRLSQKELEESYTPTLQEIQFVSAQGRGAEPRLTRLVLLKTIQCLGYFPALSTVPNPIIAHLRHHLHLHNTPISYDKSSSLSRHHQAIRNYLNIKSYSDGGESIVNQAIRQAVQTLNNPADLINVAIEQLVYQRHELPAYSTLNRLANHIRNEINQSWYTLLAKRLSTQDREILKQLPQLRDDASHTDFVVLKEVPRKPLLTEMRRLEDRLRWLEGLMNTASLLTHIPLARIEGFADEARSLETYDLRDTDKPRRYMLLVCLLHQAKIHNRDHLAEIFLKRMRRVHKKAKEELDRIRDQQRELIERLVEMMMGISQSATQDIDDASLGQVVRKTLADEGGAETIFTSCQILVAYHNDNTLPLLWKHYANHHKTVLRTIDQLNLHPTHEDNRLQQALQVLNQHQDDDFLPDDTALDFASQRWQRSIREHHDGAVQINRRQFEVCVFTKLAHDLLAGDMAVRGSKNYADYREQLLTWEECKPLLADYCVELGFSAEPDEFTQQLKNGLTDAAEKADQAFPESGQLSFKDDGRPVLKKICKRPVARGAVKLKRAIKKRIPPRTVLDGLAFVEHWVNYTRHFGPLSGSDPKITDKLSRYLMTVFAYGCNLGPVQTARHSRGKFTSRMLSFANRQHINQTKLEAALHDVVNYYSQFDLPRYWGVGKTAAADGTVFNTYLNNLMAERHIRYGEYGGVAYHHVSDNYIALFSHFISVGVWEAVYIIDGLLENTSDIQPDTLHADTQGQSLTVFGLSHLLGIELMPRIRNWKDMTLFRPNKQIVYKNIDALFTATINWARIETDYQHMLQVVLSIRAGKLLPSMILRKLGNYSRKNRLFKAFRELGRVIRTIFLLRYVSDKELRRRITATTNKIESFHHFIEWLFFGGQGVIAENDPIEMEKRIKYNDLLANALIVLNVVDMTRVILELDPKEYVITPETLATLSPYGTDHIQRFGEFVLDLDTMPRSPRLDIIPILFDENKDRQ